MAASLTLRNRIKNAQRRGKIAQAVIESLESRLLLNGALDPSFETPSVGAHQYQYNPTGGAWSFTGNTGIENNGSAFGAANAPNGVQAAFLQCGNSGTVTETVNLTAGLYSLTFDMAQRSGFGVEPIEVLVDGGLITTLSPSSSSWAQFSTSFNIFASGNHSLTFEATNPAGDCTSFIDAVDVEKSTNALANPSFETPVLSASGYQYNPTGGTWTFSSSTGLESNGSVWGAATAPDGNQAAFLQCGASGTISQTTHLNVGSYTLTFDMAQRNGYPVEPVEILVDSSVITTISPSSANWGQYSASFSVSTTGNHTITFEATNPPGDCTSFVDAIDLEQQPTAQFAGSDDQTSGQWKGVYGSQGAVILADSTNIPSYMGFTANASYSTWTAPTTDPRALQEAAQGATLGVTGVWYGQSFDINVNLSDGGTHDLSVYALDWDSTSRSETITVKNAVTGATLNTQTISNFHNGTYLSWNVQGDVDLHVSDVSGANAVISGLFIGTQAPATPATPTNLTATAASSSAINLSWTDNSGGTAGYYVDRSADGSTWTRIGSVAAGTTTYADNNLSSATTYYYRVLASKSGINSSPSNTASKMTLTAAPTSLAATAGDTTANLSWSAPGGATSYKVYRSTTSGSGYALLTSQPITITSYADSGLTDGVTYYYVVTALDSGGESVASSQVFATPQAIAPTAPSNLAASVVSSSAINLSWTDNSNSTASFLIDHSADGTNWSQIGTAGVGVTSYSDTGLTSATTYYYRVLATRLGLNSSPSNVANKMTLTVAPTSLTATAGDTLANLSWTAPTGATAYNVYRSTTSGSGYSLLTSQAITSTTYTNSGLTDGITYYYVVTALDFGGESTTSSQVSATPIPVAPTNLVAATVSSSAINLSWTDNSNGVDSFEVDRSTDGTNWSAITIVSNGTSSYADSSLSPATEYYYRVLATKSGVTSSPSNTTNDTTLTNAPGSFSASPGDGTVSLSWTAPAGAISYNLYRSTTNGTGYAIVNSQPISETTYSDSGLADGAIYYYIVKAVDSGGESAGSSQAAATPEPAAPSGLAATAISDSGINLTWTDNSGGISGFSIDRSTDGTSWTQVGTVNPGTLSFFDAALSADTIYYYEVFATNGAGISSASNTANATTALASPGSLAANAGDGQVLLAWDAVGNADSYDIYRSTASGSGYTLLNNYSITTTNYADLNATNGITYYYTVSAVMGGTETAHSSPVSATPTSGSVTAPAAPSAVIGGAQATAPIIVTWQESDSSVIGFVVERQNDGGAWQQIAQTNTDTVYDDESAQTGNTYLYRVIAIGSEKSSDPSAASPAVSLGSSAQAPDQVTATVDSSTTATVNWVDSTNDATGFDITEATPGTGNFILLGHVDANTRTYSVTGLSPNTTYFFTVAADGNWSNSGAVSSDLVTTPAITQSPPEAPTNLTAVAQSVSTVALSWQDPNGSNETGVEIESTDGTNYSVLSDVAVGVTSYSVTGLNQGTSYSFRVDAIHSAVHSGYSNVAVVTTPEASIPDAPTGVTATVSNGQLQVHWNSNAPNVDTFVIETSTDGTTFAQAGTVSGSARDYSAADPNPEGPSAVQVIAQNLQGNSNPGSASTLSDLTQVQAEYDDPQGDGDITQGGVLLGWNDPDIDLDGFRIEMNSGGGYSQVGIAPPNSNVFSLTGLNEDQTYSFRITAFKGNITSNPATVSVTMPDNTWVEDDTVRVVGPGPNLAYLVQPGQTSYSFGDYAAGTYELVYEGGGWGYTVSRPVGVPAIVHQETASYYATSGYAIINSNSTVSLAGVGPVQTEYTYYDGVNPYVQWDVDGYSNVEEPTAAMGPVVFHHNAGEIGIQFNDTALDPTGAGSAHWKLIRLSFDNPTVAVSASETQIQPGDTSITYTFTRNSVDLNYGVPLNMFFELAGTAVDGIDYAGPDDNFVTFAPGQVTATTTVTILQPTTLRGPRTIDMILMNGALHVAGAATGVTGTEAESDLSGQIQLSIDSTNTNGFTPVILTPGSAADQIKDGPPGKVVAVDQGDLNGDGIPDFADGIVDNVDDPSTIPTQLQFVPIVIQIPDNVDLTRAQLKIEYSGSDPNAISITGTGTPQDPTAYTPAPGDLRIWTGDGSNAIGDWTSPFDPGLRYYVSPNDPNGSTDYYSWSSQGDVAGSLQSLGFGGASNNHTVTLYVEAVRPTADIEHIKVELDATGTPDEGFDIGDEVAVTGYGAAIAVDANQDGKVQFDQSDQTFLNRPYSFWLNDNSDQSDFEVDASIPGTVLDSNTGIINNSRDLEDFAPLSVQLPATFIPGQNWSLQLNLISADPQMEIALVNVDTNEMTSYLTDPTVQSALPGRHVTYLTTSNTITISSQDLATEVTGNNQIDFLFEGVEAGLGTINATIFEGTNVAVTGSVNLKLQSANKMYDTWDINQSATQLYGSELTAAQVQQVATLEYSAYDANSPQTDDYTVFVHGWRLQPYEKTIYANTTFKRLFWEGYKGRFAAFDWPTEYMPLDDNTADPITDLIGNNIDDIIQGIKNGTQPLDNFDRSEEKAFASATALNTLLTNLAAQYRKPDGSSRVNVIAHSMGNIVTSEALRLAGTQKIINSYIMDQAAAPAEAYDPNVLNTPADLLSSSLVYFLQNGNGGQPYQDEWINGPGYFQNINGAANSIYNFFNTNDIAMLLWQANELIKPDTEVYRNGDYDTYSWDQTNIMRTLYNASTWSDLDLSDPMQRYEAFAYAVQAESMPLGSTGNVHGSVTQDFDLATLINNLATDHSGEFDGGTATRLGYWAEVMTCFGLVPVFPG